ncbi:hypothetical protein vBEcoMWL3_gp111 [Escherichia phage vB_EcoM_WL-3]|nr:hypothetical protein vBEcoMWL3_gp111 [Escherichia phage vB_EcoM_WL-3]
MLHLVRLNQNFLHGLLEYPSDVPSFQAYENQ